MPPQRPTTTLTTQPIQSTRPSGASTRINNGTIRRQRSSSVRPYPSNRRDIAQARTNVKTDETSRQVLAEIDWWVRMSGQLEEIEEDEYEDWEDDWQTLRDGEETMSEGEDDDARTVDAQPVEEREATPPASQETQTTEIASRAPSPFFPTTLPPLAPLLSSGSQISTEPSRLRGSTSRVYASRSSSFNSPHTPTRLTWDYSTSSMVVTSLSPPDSVMSFGSLSSGSSAESSDRDPTPENEPLPIQGVQARQCTPAPCATPAPQTPRARARTPAANTSSARARTPTPSLSRAPSAPSSPSTSGNRRGSSICRAFGVAPGSVSDSILKEALTPPPKDRSKREEAEAGNSQEENPASSLMSSMSALFRLCRSPWTNWTSPSILTYR